MSAVGCVQVDAPLDRWTEGEGRFYLRTPGMDRKGHVPGSSKHVRATTERTENNRELGMAVYTCNASSQEAEVGGLWESEAA